jgi:hypothetical protein
MGKIIPRTVGLASFFFCSITDGLAPIKVDGGITLEIEEVSVGEPISVPGAVLLPIVRTSMSCRNINSGIVGSGSKNLVGIVIISSKWKHAINLAGEEIPLDQYIEQVPELKELLQGI